MAWRNKTLSELSPGFQRMVAYGRLPNPECRLCQKVAELRFAKEMEGTAAGGASEPQIKVDGIALTRDASKTQT